MKRGKKKVIAIASKRNQNKIAVCKGIIHKNKKGKRKGDAQRTSMPRVSKTFFS